MIPKKTGGNRTISHPSIEVKFLQRWLIDNIFEYLPIHDSVYSYRKGRNIKDLAQIHSKNKYLLKMDFENFFPSIAGKDISILIQKNKEKFPYKISENDKTIINSIVCKKDCLTIGAPSSPIISNAILYNFDLQCYKMAQERNSFYSRYSDDIYFSSNKPCVLEDILNQVIKILDNTKSPKLTLNNNKTSFSSKKYRRIVTGLVITPDNKVSIGRKRKRYIKSLIYRYTKDTLNDRERAYLQGYLSYVNAVEPFFLFNLKKKYGEETISEIINHP